MPLLTYPPPSTIKPPQTLPVSGAAPSPTAGAGDGAAYGEGGLYCHRTTKMSILNKRRIYVKIELVHVTTWVIQNPQWRSNLHWISAANEEMSGNFISHLLDSGFDSVLESLVTYLGMDSL